MDGSVRVCCCSLLFLLLVRRIVILLFFFFAAALLASLFSLISSKNSIFAYSVQTLGSGGGGGGGAACVYVDFIFLHSTKTYRSHAPCSSFRPWFCYVILVLRFVLWFRLFLFAFFCIYFLSFELCVFAYILYRDMLSIRFRSVWGGGGGGSNDAGSGVWMDYFWSYNWFEVKQATTKGCRTHTRIIQQRYRGHCNLQWVHSLFAVDCSLSLSLSIALPPSIYHLLKIENRLWMCARIELPFARLP